MPTLLLLPDGQGQIPPASVIAGWPTVNKVYLEPAPKDADRSHCWRCQSKERRVKWCGSLEQVLCDTCLKECEVEIKSIQAAERKRRGLLKTPTSSAPITTWSWRGQIKRHMAMRCTVEDLGSMPRITMVSCRLSHKTILGTGGAETLGLAVFKVLLALQGCRMRSSRPLI